MKKIAIILMVLFATFSVFNLALADNPSTQSAAPSTSLNNPLGTTNDVPTLIGKVISGALGVVGSLALLMFIYGGFMWMLSGGNEKMVEKGKSTLIWAALGLVIIFMSYAIVKFVITTTTGS